MDNYSAGKDALNKLRSRLATLRVNHDVFLLHRHIPRETRDPEHLEKLIRRANSQWSAMDCEIEDLLNEELLDDFRREDPRRCRREPQRCSGGHHYEFAKDAKSALYRHVAAHAMLSDLTLPVELLKSLRFLLGLNPDGESMDGDEVTGRTS